MPIISISDRLRHANLKYFQQVKDVPILSISVLILPPGIAGTPRSGRSCCSQPEVRYIKNRVELPNVATFSIIV